MTTLELCVLCGFISSPVFCKVLLWETVPAVHYDWPGVWRITGFDSAQEGEEGRGVFRYTVIGPRRELELTDLSLLTAATLSAQTHAKGNIGAEPNKQVRLYMHVWERERQQKWQRNTRRAIVCVRVCVCSPYRVQRSWRSKQQALRCLAQTPAWGCTSLCLGLASTDHTYSAHSLTGFL